MSKQIEIHQAFVLHRRPYRESSMLIELFSADYGRIGAVAKGVQRPKSRLRPVLQMYQPLQVVWMGRSDLVTLTTAEADGPVLLRNGKALLHGFYINELIMRLVHRHESLPGVYQIYRDILLQLDCESEPEAILRRFEKRLLEELGYGLILDHDENGKLIDSEALYQYEVESGPVIFKGLIPPASAIQGTTLLAMARDVFSGTDQLREAKQILRRVLSHYLGSKPLETRKLYASYLQQATGTQS